MSDSRWDAALVRACFVAICVSSAVYFPPFGWASGFVGLFAALFSLGVILLELKLRRARLTALLGGFAGLFLGLCLGSLLVAVLSSVAAPETNRFLHLLLPATTAFLGWTAGLAKSSLLNLATFRLFAKGQSGTELVRYLDTSALIDARIADIADSGFLDGDWIIPQFILNELQTIADSPDGAKRNRGRRGLDVVQRLQKASGIRIEISPVDFPHIREVDWKLIEAAKSRNAQIVTTDFNLNKLAQVQSLRVLNVNELANALRPVVLQGETMRVFIAKEGKEAAQGLAYLDDGTMVVVDNGRRYIGSTVDIVVTSVIQSAAGKMIFGKFDGRVKDGASERPTTSGSADRSQL